MKPIVRVILLTSVISAGAEPAQCESGPKPSRAGSPWSLECSVSGNIPWGVNGSLLSRDDQNGDLHVEVMGETPVLGFAVGYSASAHFSSRLEFLTWSAQFGERGYLGVGDSLSIGEFAICRASSRTALLSIRWHSDPDLFYEGTQKKINVCVGPALGVTWLDPVSPNVADPAEMGLTSVRAEPGFVWGGVSEIALRFGRSRWVSGLKMCVLAGGASLQLGTSDSSRWQAGQVRVSLVSVGFSLSYRFP